MKDQGGCEKIPNTSWEDVANHMWRVNDMVRRVDRHGEAVMWCRKVFGLCAAKTGTRIDEPIQAGGTGH